MRRFLPALLLAAIGCGKAREEDVPPPASARPPAPSGAPASAPPEKPAPPPAARKVLAGLVAPVGPLGTPTRVRTLTIDRPGVYENYLVDAEFAPQDAVRIKADRVVLRHCEIRNGARDGIEVYASDVLIENCRIHHFLNGSFAPHLDAHGITGQPTRLTIRNCEISYVSGDCVQFDPGRKPWTDVVIENCVFFTGPLPEAAGGFKKGERPGENAVDTKQSASHPRSRLTIRDTVCHGWQQPAQIENMSALNLKNHVDAKVERCVFYDNEISLRLRGPQGGADGFGGAWVTAEDCAFYSSVVAVRLEDRIENTRILNPRYGPGVKERVTGDRKTGPGTRVDTGSDAPPLATLLGRE
ncbi:MAG TPA: right-handed parallel beta-helix repeat-containing protein [Planctomycetota bacterium]|nr:right-handed parallel beta-helix repeat-containing protein [Planctomycetota bacterium]